MARIKPGEEVSDLSLDLINGTTWKLSEQSDEDHPWRMIVVYRGLHCPVCKKQLSGLQDMLTAFADEGVSVVSASMDTRERAQQAYDEWGLGDLPVAYELGEDFAERFGLYLSDAISENEPDRFIEPAILLFHKKMFYTAWIQTIPFARPQFDDVLGGLKFIKKEDYPPRGKLG